MGTTILRPQDRPKLRHMPQSSPPINPRRNPSRRKRSPTNLHVSGGDKVPKHDVDRSMVVKFPTKDLVMGKVTILKRGVDLKTEDKKTEDLKTEDLKIDDLKTEDLKIDDLKTEDLKIDDLKTEDLKIDDLKTEDLKIDDLKTEDLKIDDLKTEDLKIEDLKVEYRRLGEVVKDRKVKFAREDDLVLCSMERLVPESEMVQKLVTANKFSNQEFNVIDMSYSSPEPSSLPFRPPFFSKNLAATCDLRRLLHLDLF